MESCSKTHALEKRVEELAEMLGGDFLREMNGNPRLPIRLFHSEQLILDLLKAKLDAYFAKKGKGVMVLTGGESEPNYPIDVGYFGYFFSDASAR